MTNGTVLWEGPSRINGERVAVIVTGLKRPSQNVKTGPALQVWILAVDRPPHEAVRAGQDEAVCGGCPLAGGRGCYVRVEQAPLAVWKAYHAGRYGKGGQWSSKGRVVRLGAYGDPGAVPRRVVRAAKGERWTGYTHQWKGARLQGECMASVHTPGERARARAKGYRTFRTADDGPQAGEIICPATKEGGERTTCDRCRLCDGSRGPGDQRKDVFAFMHGARKGRALMAIGGK